MRKLKRKWRENEKMERCVLRHNRMANQQMEVISFFVVFVRANQTLPPRCPSAQSETAPTWAPTTGATNTDSQ